MPYDRKRDEGIDVMTIDVMTFLTCLCSMVLYSYSPGVTGTWYVYILSSQRRICASVQSLDHLFWFISRKSCWRGFMTLVVVCMHVYCDSGFMAIGTAVSLSSSPSFID